MHKRSSTMATSCSRSRELGGPTGRTVVVASSQLDVMGGARPRPVGSTYTMGIRGPYATSIPTRIPITKVLDTESILFCCRPIQVQRVPLTLRQFPQYRFYFRPPRFGRVALIAGHCAMLFLLSPSALLRQQGQLQLPLPLCESPTLIYCYFASLRDC